MSFLFDNYLGEMICGGLSGLAFCVFGVFVLVMNARDRKKAQASMGWPSVEGKILEQHVRVDMTSDEDGTRVSYVPEALFGYAVEGSSYTGKRIEFGMEPSFNVREKAENFLTPYPTGSTVTVFYNPENPQEAVLLQSMRKKVVGLIAGIVLLVLGAFLIIYAGIGLIKVLFP
jgi:hypothetical protein